MLCTSPSTKVKPKSWPSCGVDWKSGEEWKQSLLYQILGSRCAAGENVPYLLLFSVFTEKTNWCVRSQTGQKDELCSVRGNYQSAK